MWEAPNRQDRGHKWDSQRAYPIPVRLGHDPLSGLECFMRGLGSSYLHQRGVRRAIARVNRLWDRDARQG